MEELTRPEAAKRAGVSVNELDRVVERGIVRPAEGDRFTSGDVRKLGLLAALQRGGLPLEGIADQIQAGQISLDFLQNPT